MFPITIILGFDELLNWLIVGDLLRWHNGGSQAINSIKTNVEWVFERDSGHFKRATSKFGEIERLLFVRGSTNLGVRICGEQKSCRSLMGYDLPLTGLIMWRMKLVVCLGISLSWVVFKVQLENPWWSGALSNGIVKLMREREREASMIRSMWSKNFQSNTLVNGKVSLKLQVDLQFKVWIWNFKLWYVFTWVTIKNSIKKMVAH